MAGIYLHIPFCKRACHYCDFHFTTSLTYKKEMLAAMQQELVLRKDYLEEEAIETIYFGGGTPSLLSASEIQAFVDQIAQLYVVAEKPEITIEANPDDLSEEKVRALAGTPVNRFSVGIQSFFEEDLRWMNRAHNSQEAENSIKRLQDKGFENITLDLIYGYPLLTNAKWEENIEKSIHFNVPHLSAYSMTIEPQTALASFIRKGKQQPMDEAQSAEQFQTLISKLREAGYEHYEISNFAFPGRYSRHNTNYWKGVKYLGIGPSAHSYNAVQRQWNVSNNAIYLRTLKDGSIAAEAEELSKQDRLNEYIMTSLRTMWGMDLTKIELEFGSNYRVQVEKRLREFLLKEWLVQKEGTVILSENGKLFADLIAAELFV